MKTEAKTEPKTLLQKLLDDGIPVKKAVFHQAVANGYIDNETNFSSDDPKVNRKAEMWFTPNLLICLQNERYFAVPLSNVVYIRF